MKRFYSIPYPKPEPASMKVSEYMDKYIPKEYRFKFRRLMIQWDGRMDVGGAFYSMDLLNMKKKECME